MIIFRFIFYVYIAMKYNWSVTVGNNFFKIVYFSTVLT